MDEKSDPHAEQSRAEYAAEKAAEPLRNSSAGVIHKAREVGRDNFLAIFIGSVMISFLLGYLVSRQRGEFGHYAFFMYFIVLRSFADLLHQSSFYPGNSNQASAAELSIE